MEENMPRISKEKKEETRSKILVVSKRLFIENGYFKTNISQIAEEVGIAEGTIFNYFDTKADIFIEAVATDHFNFTIPDYLECDLSPSVTIVIMRFINIVLDNILYLPKKVLIELGTAALSKATAKEDIVSNLVMIDKKYTEQLVGFICYLKKEKRISDCNCKILGDCIFDIVLIELFVYLNVQDRTKEEVVQSIEQKIDAILKGCSVN
jgi:AcrR family transcriptional regulator